MSASEKPPTIESAHLYSGKIFQIWCAWQANKPEHYALGSSNQEARENLSLKIDVEFGDWSGGGIVARCPTLEGVEGYGGSTMSAERDLIRKINLKNGRVDWKELFLDLAARTSWSELPLQEEERRAISKELDRRRIARQYLHGGDAAGKSGGGSDGRIQEDVVQSVHEVARADGGVAGVDSDLSQEP